MGSRWTLEGGTTRPPKLTLTVVVTFLFGVFGAIPAWLHGQRAKEVGSSAGRYWVAFAVTLLVSTIAYFLLVISILGWVASSLTAATTDTTYPAWEPGSDSAATGAAAADEAVGSSPAVGTCFSADHWNSGSLELLEQDVLPCAQPHEAEVVGVGDLYTACDAWEAQGITVDYVSYDVQKFEWSDGSYLGLAGGNLFGEVQQFVGSHVDNSSQPVS